MRRKCRGFAGVLGVILLLVLTGCFPTEKRTPSETGENVELKIKDNKVEMSLGKNLTIQAELPNEPTNPQILRADWTDFDFQTASNLLLKGEGIVSDVELPEKNFRDEVTHYYTGEQGSILSLSPGELYFVKAGYLKKAYGNVLSNYNLYGNQLLEQDFQKLSSAVVDKEQAIQTSEELLNALGIEHLSHPRVILLDVATLQEKSAAAMHIQTVKKLDPFTSEDDAYLLLYQIEEAGLPITQTGYYTKSTNGDTIPCLGTRIEVLVTKDGVAQLEIQSSYTATAETTLTKHTDFQTILDQVNGKYKELLLEDPLRITQVAVEYLPVEKADSWLLEPYWILSVQQKTTYTDEKGTSEITESFPLFYSYETGEEKEIENIQ